MNPGPLERETCRDVVVPALAAAGWDSTDIREQYLVKGERVLTLGARGRRVGDGFVDYVLEVDQVPVAVVEAKRAYRAASDGIQQAVRYAQQLDVPLAYATNGATVIERDMQTGRERVVEGYATPPEAWEAYVRLHNLDREGGELQRQGFNRRKRLVSGDVQEPRWYQAVAIRRVLTAIARGERRVLLLMATGTGKTFTAMQIVYLLRSFHETRQSGRNYRVLYLADRDVLVSDPMGKDFLAAFDQGPLHRVTGAVNLNREIYFATYQSLVQGDEDSLDAYRPDFFDLVIVDECHRGSASENSSWRRVLEHFDSAIQLGLTATPKQDDTVDTYRYFGEPVFSYSLRQGIEDGYLAPYRFRRVTLSPDADGWEPDPGEVDRYGREIPDGIYGTRDFERVVRLLARTDLAARYLTDLLRDQPRARTMIFCVDTEHAEDMRVAMSQANLDRMAADPEWVVRIVGVEEERVRLLKSFCDPESGSPVVATTSRLLSTGVDVPDLKYVVLFRPVGSMVEFKQIVGRGTRLYPDNGKTSFEIVDFVGATRHFEDPDFDGYPTAIIHDPPLGGGEEGDLGEETYLDPQVAEPEPPFEVRDPSEDGDDHDGQDDDHPVDGPGHPRAWVVDSGGFEVISESLHVVDTSTGALRLTEYGEHVAGVVRRLSPTASDLAVRWSRRPGRAEVVAALADEGVAVGDLAPAGEGEVDPFDLLVQIAWGTPSRTRAERARRVREQHHAELEERSDLARRVLSRLLDIYAERGIDEIGSPEMLRLPELAELGSVREISRAFGDPAAMHGAIDELQGWLYLNSSA